jgi:very-short-patch-repair endonuclease
MSYSNGQRGRYNLKYYRDVLALGDDQIERQDDSYQVICKHCGNWFKPTPTQLSERMRAIRHTGTHPYVHNYFYCTGDCKKKSDTYSNKCKSHREKISKAVSGENNGCFGRSFTEEQLIKIRESAKRWIRTDEIKKKISESNKGQRRSKETCLKISKSKKGIPLSEDHKEKIRNTHINNLLLRGIKLPYVGFFETPCLDIVENHINHTIIRNERMYGYFPDGYIPELSLLIEFDEPHHYRCGELCDHDIIRQKSLELKSGCSMFRIDSRDWDSNKLKILSNLSEIINAKQKR